MRRQCSLLLVLSLAVTAAGEDKLAFKTAPQVRRDGERWAISFELSASADVEVAILDAKGDTVRHLAAGVLGAKNPPPPPLQSGLKQKLSWDGKNDRAAKAEGGPFQLRVRAGSSVRLGRMIGESPYTGSVTAMPYRAPVNGLAVDGEGKLHVLMMSAIGSHGNSGLWPWHLRRFDRDGKYERTLFPYPPSTKPAQASGFALLETDAFTPSLKTSLYPVFASLGNEIVPRLADGRAVFVHSEARKLHFFALDGSNRLTTVPMWPAKANLKCPIWLDIQTALSPDGKYAYYANVAGTAYDGKKPSDIDSAWPQGRVYRHDLTREGSIPEPFFDLIMPDWDKEKYWMPSAWDKKTAAAALDTDAKGNVLICDLVNHQVVEVDAAGKRLSDTAVPWPDKVLVSRKTGDLYVLSRKVSRGFLPPATLRKITGRGAEARTVAEITLPGTVGGGATLDESGKSPILWLAGQVQETGTLLRVEDRGDKLHAEEKNYLNRDPNAIGFVGYMDVDRAAETVYVTRSGGTVWRFNGATGEGGPLAIKAVDLAVGPGGDVYTWGTSGSYEGPIGRFDGDLKPKPLPATGKHTYGQLYGRAGRGSSVCGMDVDAQGRVYAVWGTNECHVRVYDDKGDLVPYERKFQSPFEGIKQEIPVAIRGVSGCGGSFRVDTAGNLYILQQGVPKDYPTPPGFEKDEAYRSAVGTIWKFPPAGGEFKRTGEKLEEAVGAISSYPGCGPVSRWNAVGSCVCTKPRFDVDDYGRLFIPNGVTFSVSVRDNAGNEIVRFGAYGNFDCQGPGENSREPKPAIPLGWPIAVAAGEKHLYVGDCLNHRVVRIDWRYALEKTITPTP